MRHRVFTCGECGKEVRICRRCDRGHRYCSPTCSQAAREASCRKAQRKYQQSRDGRWCHAERQQRYRERKRKIVTHQGSGKPPLSATMESATVVAVREREEATVPTPGTQRRNNAIDVQSPCSSGSVSPSITVGDVCCHFCGRPLGLAVPRLPEHGKVIREDTQTSPEGRSDPPPATGGLGLD